MSTAPPLTDGRGRFETQAEVLKLARLVHRDPDTLAYLDQLPLEDLRKLREQTTNVLFSSDQKTLVRLASAAKLLPVGVTATITQRAFGPVLAARIAGLLEPGRAVEVASKLPAEFVADIAVELDPRRSTDVIAQIPPPQVAAVTEVLVRRGEYVTMGSFVGHLSDPALRAALAAMDAKTVLRVGFVLEDKARLDHVVGLLELERLHGLIEAATSGEMWSATLDVLSYLSTDKQRELVELAIDEGDAVLESLVAAAERDDMWGAVMRMESVIGEQSRERFVAFIHNNHPELVGRLDL